MPWEKVVLKDGYTYTDWREPLPRIPDRILNSIVYLYDDILNAAGGVDAGGSGFLIFMLSEVRNYQHIYVVTNAHVVESGFRVVRVNLKDPSSGFERTECLDFPVDSWVIHPNHDLAVRAMPADLDLSLFNLSLLGMDFLVTREEMRDKDIGAGDDLVYIGRFMGHAGKYQNLPSVRFGNISTVPNEDEPIEYEVNGHNRKQVGFLVEARSRSGYSGSPVFFMHRHAVNNSRAVFLEFDLRLLGIDWGHIPETVNIVDRNGHLHGDRWCIEVHAGMMGVIPAWYLDDFIKTSPRLVEQRKRDDEYYRSHPPIGVAD